MTNYFARLDPYEMSINGLVFAAPFYLELSGNETVNLQIKTGTTTAMIIAYRISTTAEPLKVSAIESPTITDGTTPIPSYKVNRQRTGSSTISLFSNPTSVSGGTLINVDVTTAGKHSGGGFAMGHPWILKKSTSYQWKIEQLSNSATKVAGELVWAEGYPSS